MTEKRVRFDVDDDGVAKVIMERTDKHNALDREMFDALLEAADRLAANSRIRAAVLHGAGKSFCAGLDIVSFLGQQGGDIDALFVRKDGELADYAQRAAHDWSRVPIPVIAAISGNCFGGGLQIALGADIRIAAPDAKLSIMEVKWGLVPDMAITQTLPRVVRIDVAKELTYAGRIVSGTEAQTLGLVTRIAEDPFAAALDLAREIAQKSPHAVRAAKRLYEETWTGVDPAAALVLESELQMDLLGKPNQVEAVAAGLLGRAPVFRDPD